MNKVENFTLHNDRDQSVLAKDLLTWVDELNHPSGIFGPVVRHTWVVSGKSFDSAKGGYWRVLPDSSGFICFERESKPNNCVLLDAYGKERMRLSVPWKMTGATDPEAEQVSTFDNISAPYVNPVDGKEGQFGVVGWVGERKYYFELDYHTGQFLWCKPIRD